MAQKLFSNSWESLEIFLWIPGNISFFVVQLSGMNNLSDPVAVTWIPENNISEITIPVT